MQQLIQGRTPGVTMMNSTGVIGGGSRTRIRGSGSLNAGNEPVVFVDGVRVQSGQSRTSGNFTDVRTCGFHDHNEPSTTGLQGRITIVPQ